VTHSAAGTKRRRNRRSRGALAFLATLLLISGSIRLGTGMGEALTAEVAPVAGPATGTSATVAIEPLLAELRAREARLAKREAAFEERLQALAVTEARVQAQLAELIAAEERLADTLALADRAAERDLDRLTAVYQNMKPKEAAALFEEMDAQFAAGFLGRMHPEPAAAIMAGLTPHTAYSISVLLAGRHVKVPTE
jgi:flagellar motility protein MotE (MotC chaperone)